MKFMHRMILLLTLLAIPATVIAHPLFGIPRHRGVEPLINKAYSQSCGECHFAYQPGLLPKRSWVKMMDPKQLADHFGENAELAENERQAILNFLTENAADTVLYYKVSIKINRSIADDAAPLRISQTPYIKKKHAEIPQKLTIENKRVRSLSYCNRCHTRADQGDFNEDEIDVPGFRNWKDLVD